MNESFKLTDPIYDSLMQRVLEGDPTMPAITAHAWGWSVPLFIDEHTEVIFFSGKAGFTSSWHLHEEKDNDFSAISGIVTVEHENHLNEMETSAVSQYSSLGVVSNKKHRMVFKTDAIGIETYCTRPDIILRPGEGDIVRFSEGGPINE